MNHLGRATLAVLVALIAILALLRTAYSDPTSDAPTGPTEDVFVFLPIIYGSTSPAGAYYCYEYEFGLIWTSEVITLNIDGGSIYHYNPPYTAIVTGTWVYTHVSQEVGFTNFRWLTTTFEPPDRLWARRYLTYTGFEIAVSCNRLE